MSYLRGPDRSEVQLLPPCLDDYLAANAPARFLDAYVEGLDFAALGFTHARPKDTGRPPYHPADLLKLYLYGYLYRVRSSRRLEAEALRNLEVVWLLRGCARTSRPSPISAGTTAPRSSRCSKTSTCCAARRICSGPNWWPSTAANSRRPTTPG